MRKLVVMVNNEVSPGMDAYETRAFGDNGIEYRRVTTTNADEIVAAAENAPVLLFTAAKFPAELFDRLPNLKLLVRYGIGFDTVDTAAARAHGVDVCNCPTYGCYDVAEHAFSLLMSANRRIVNYDRGIREGKWGNGGDYEAHRLQGKTLGLVGFGRIARMVAQFAQGFSMQILAYDPFLPAEMFAKAGAVSATLDEVLTGSDFISLHAPMNAENAHLINREAFAKMKPSAVLINTARGGLVDQDALYDALASRRIRAAGIDVWDPYPNQVGDRFHALDNIVMTPHMAWNSPEAVADLVKEATEEAMRFFRGEALTHIVNR